MDKRMAEEKEDTQRMAEHTLLCITHSFFFLNCVSSLVPFRGRWDFCIK